MDALKPRERLLGPALRTQPDRRLVALARDGSTPAQEEIVRRYRAALVRYAGSIVGAAAAEDVVQEALAKGVAALAAADEELQLRPWLYAIVRNTGLNHLRDAGPATEQLDENYDGVEQPPQALERREGVRSLVGGLRRLPPQQREAIVKRELEGRSHEEIAVDLGVSSGAARQLIFRAREALRVGFGSLLPMPLLRWLAEGGAGDAAVGAAAGAGGGALAAKAAVAVFAAGAAVTAGVAIDHGARHRPAEPPAAEAAVRPAVALPDRGTQAATAPVAEPVSVAVGGEDPGAGTNDNSGRGSDSSGPGSGGERDDGDHDRGGDGGQEASEHSGPGRGGEESAEDFEDDGSGHGEHSGRGPGRSGGDEDRSGSSHGGKDSGSSGKGDDDSHGDGGSRDSGSSGGSGKGSSSGSSDGDSGDSSGSGSSGGSNDEVSGGGESDGGGGDDDFEVAPSTPTPPPPPPPVEESSSGSGSSGSGGSSGGGEFAEESRDLSGGSVSQGSDDPD